MSREDILMERNKVKMQDFIVYFYCILLLYD